MLKGIPKSISPDLLKYMMEMGHSDKLLITDANFPAKAHSKRYILAEGVQTDELLEAILQFFPLDNFIESPVTLMSYRKHEEQPEVWREYEKLLKKYDEDNAFDEFHFEERINFYEIAQKSYCIVQTSDTRRYANILIQKGVC